MIIKLTNELRELRERNESRLAEAKAKLGTTWLLHPNNKITKKEMNANSKY